jgi:hypothetical protein
VSYVIAILGLAAACAVWYLVQRWAGLGDDPPREDDDPHCAVCESRGPDCPPPPPSSSRTPHPSRGDGRTEDRPKE